MKPATKKRSSLMEQGSFNRQAHQVKEEIFKTNPFFDPHDLAQVKYEMVRQVASDGKSISEASETFGVSRPTFYQAKLALELKGLLGLIPKKTGPKNRHKLSPEIMAYVTKESECKPELDSVTLAKIVLKKFQLTVHPRSIERALSGQKKN
jgi:transposase